MLSFYPLSSGEGLRMFGSYAEAKMAESAMPAGQLVQVGNLLLAKSGDLSMLVPASLYLAPGNPMARALVFVPSRVAALSGLADGQTLTTFASLDGSVWTLYQGTPGTITYHASGGMGGGAYFDLSSGACTFVSTSPKAKALGRKTSSIAALFCINPDTINNKLFFRLRNATDSDDRLRLTLDNAVSVGLGDDDSFSMSASSGLGTVVAGQWNPYAISAYCDINNGADNNVVAAHTLRATFDEQSKHLAYAAGYQAVAHGTGLTPDTDNASVEVWGGRNTGFSFSGGAAAFCALSFTPRTAEEIAAGEPVRRITPAQMADLETWLRLESSH